MENGEFNAGGDALAQVTFPGRFRVRSCNSFIPGGRRVQRGRPRNECMGHFLQSTSLVWVKIRGEPGWNSILQPPNQWPIDERKDFAEYAEACFSSFGDRVKHWMTFNEPYQFACQGYGEGSHAPGRCSDRKLSADGNSATEPYLVAHDCLLAHAAASGLYKRKFKAASEWLYIVPWVFEKTLTWISKRYNQTQMYITENGMDDQDDVVKPRPKQEMLTDTSRIDFYEGYLVRAIRDVADVRGYFAQL